MTSQTITATGSGSFTIPAGVTTVTCEAWGAGGGGADGSSTSAPGGGGGGYSLFVATGLTPGGTIFYSVGTHGVGTGGGSGHGGTDGGVSWVNPSANSQPAANGAVGGGGGGGSATGSSGTAGVGSIGTTNFNGGAGGNGAASNGGGGGGGAGSGGNGSNGGAGGGTQDTATNGGAGGTPDGGNGSTGSFTTAHGGVGAQPGGAGGGSWNSGQVGHIGGDGQVRFTWTPAAGTPPLKLPRHLRIKRGRWNNILDLRGRRSRRLITPPAVPSHIQFKKPPRPRIKKGRWNVLRRDRLRYVVPSGRALVFNQLIPNCTQTFLFANSATRHLVFNQTVPPCSQSFTLIGSKTLDFDPPQLVPPCVQVMTFAGAGATTARLPDNIMKGAKGGPRFSTSKLIGFSGIEQRVINFEQSINAYTLGYGLNKTTWPTVLALHYAQLGGAYGFAAKDWSDYQIAAQSIGTGDGATTDFQLIKTYATAVRSYTRIITQPRAATLVVKVNGTPTGAYTLRPNGIVRFNSAPAAAAALTASCDFDMLVAFDQQSDHLDIQMQLSDAGQIPTINLKEIPPTATGLPVLHVISAPSGNVDSTTLPENVEKAARGGPTFSTTRLVSTSGKPFLAANYPQSVNTYTIGYTVDDVTWPTVLSMFYAQHGAAYGFTFRDWSDYKVTAQQIGVGDGSTQSFQLVRLYDDGPRRYGRYITLPEAGSLTVTLNGTPTAAYTLQANGVVHLNSAPAAGVVVAASFSFFIPVRFADDHLDVTIQPGMAAPATMGQIVTINLIEILAGSP